MFPRKRWFASRPGVSLPGTHKKASTRGRFSSNWSQTKKLAGFSNVQFSKIPLPRYLPGKMMTDVALNIHFKVDKYFGNICDQPMGNYIDYTFAHQKENVWFVQLFGQTISGVKLFHGCNPGLLKVPRIFKADKTNHWVIRTPEQLTHVLSEKFFSSVWIMIMKAWRQIKQQRQKKRFPPFLIQLVDSSKPWQLNSTQKKVQI